MDVAAMTTANRNPSVSHGPTTTQSFTARSSDPRTRFVDIRQPARPHHARMSASRAEDPYRFFTFEVTYGQISPLGVPQRGILINGQFPAPTIDCITNDNVIVNVINKLDEPFLITWNGVKQRKSSWQDGVLGTNCPIPPNSNWTYQMQMKDQIGSYSYFPSTEMHRASGGFGAIVIRARAVIFVPYLKPVEEFTLLISDWWKSDHKVLSQTLDSGKPLPMADALLINGLPSSTSFTVLGGCQMWL
ncbi:hypothetical protein SSX86_019033 [Deinandra increscens subsp. villosa]|uniref:Plastocyanin-like domain-containing protein n=1 Tax=Deinandra increscens subsp. villosa TaxID=3103831 RepID=A0AAP0CS04_9ASTR